MGSHPASLPLPTSHSSDDYDDTDDDDPFNPQVQTLVCGGSLGCQLLGLKDGWIWVSGSEGEGLGLGSWL